MRDKPRIHVSLVALPGTLVMPIAGLYEILNVFPTVAAFSADVPASPPFDVEIVGAARTTLAAASGLPIAVQRSIDEVQRTDIVIIPVMAVDNGGQAGGHPELVDWLKRMHGQGVVLCSACTGLVVLAQTGLLDGRRATTHWAFAPSFRRQFPQISLCVEEVLVTEGEADEFVMSGGAASWQDLVLYLIGRYVSPAASQAIAKFELLERHAAGQSPYVPFAPSTRHGDALVLCLQQWLDANFTTTSPVAEMTRRSGLSARALERRFRRATGHSPIGYVQRIRVEEAKRRLERSTVAIDQIGWDVGYEDATAFRRVFKRIAGIAPSIYRRQFRMPELG